MRNFLKGGIFSRRSGVGDEVPVEERSGVLAVWGSPGSGKTVVAVKIAKYLADQKKKTALLLCDMTAPMLPCICPSSDLENERSLGSILAASQVTESLVKHMTAVELVDALYTEMAEFGFLTKYVFGSGIEELNLNSWNDIVVHYSDGRAEKIAERFESPLHAINVVRRMLHVSGVVLDNAAPTANASLSKNIRIAALKTPVVDEDVGVAASIRIVNPQRLQKEDFVRGGTATESMMDFLSACLRYGASICVAGATSSGKTTVAGWLLTTVPDHMRLFTIENGSRELDLVRHNEDGSVRNNVIHTITQNSDNEAQCVTQEDLLDMSLRFNPHIICVGEMRSAEAYAAQEAGRTGHTLLTTIHANSAEATHYRMMTLCKRAHDMKDETLMALVAEAFPIIVFTKQLEDKSRKIMQIMECEIMPDGCREYRSLFKYNVTQTRFEDNRFIISGYHSAEQPISKSLEHKFLENGMPKDEIELLHRPCLKITSHAVISQTAAKLSATGQSPADGS
jgi:pilus assembly protein CpaF